MVLISLLLASPLTLIFASFGESQVMSADIIFPPALPTLWNLKALCTEGKSRPRYPAYLFPRSGFSYARRRGAAINRVEAWFSMCCHWGTTQKEEILCCTKQAWQSALLTFCEEEHSVMTLAYPCCNEKGEDMWSCFMNEAPNPYYLPTPGYIAPYVPTDMMFYWDSKSC